MLIVYLRLTFIYFYALLKTITKKKKIHIICASIPIDPHNHNDVFSQQCKLYSKALLKNPKFLQTIASTWSNLHYIKSCSHTFVAINYSLRINSTRVGQWMDLRFDYDSSSTRQCKWSTLFRRLTNFTYIWICSGIFGFALYVVLFNSKR